MSNPVVANLLISWLVLPLAAAFLAALLPALARWLVCLSACLTVMVGAWAYLGGSQVLELIGPLGVELQVDSLSAPFLILNGLVLLGVLIERWRHPPQGPFLILLPVLMSGANSSVVATDLLSLYIALEVVGITAFLLILRNRDSGQLWIGLRYLLVSNGVMTFYLIGVALLYLQVGSFRLAALSQLPSTDRGLTILSALILMGLLTKSGVFLSGLWLPRTHAEAPADVSALLSGMVVAAALCPLLRLSVQVPSLQPLLFWLGLASCLLGLVFALLESDLKRLLAWSTVSQVGLVLLNPLAGGLFVLAHGLAKACLFLVSGHVPSRRLDGWSRRPLPPGLALPLILASLSIAGAPPLLGFWSKQALVAAPLPGAIPADFSASGLSSLLSLGTASVYARLCWLSVRPGSWLPSPGALTLALALLLAGFLPLVAWDTAGGWFPGTAATLASVGKSLAILAAAAGLQALCQWSSHSRGGASPGPLPALPLPNLERLSDLFGGLVVMGAGVMLFLWQQQTFVGIEFQELPWPG